MSLFLALTCLSLPAARGLHLRLEASEEGREERVAALAIARGAAGRRSSPVPVHHHDESRCEICQMIAQAQGGTGEVPTFVPVAFLDLREFEIAQPAVHHFVSVRLVSIQQPRAPPVA